MDKVMGPLSSILLKIPPVVKQWQDKEITAEEAMKKIAQIHDEWSRYGAESRKGEKVLFAVIVVCVLILIALFVFFL